MGGIECGDRERSVERAEELHGARPEAPVLECYLFPQQQRKRCDVVKNQSLLLRLEKRDLSQALDPAFQFIDRTLNLLMLIQRFRDQFHAFCA